MENTIVYDNTTMDNSGNWNAIYCITCGKQVVGYTTNGAYCTCSFKLCCYTTPLTGTVMDTSMNCSSETINVTNMSSTFMTAYSVTEQKINTGSAVVLDTHSVACGSCMHLPNSTEIWIWKAGYYQIYTNIYHLEACQFSLVKNGTDCCPEHTVGSLAGSSQNSTTSIMLITSADIMMPTDVSPIGMGCKLELINNTIYPNQVTLLGSTSTGNIKPQITASLSLLLIQEENLYGI